MKKRSIFALIFVLACLSASAACANSWGLRGELLDAVSDVNTWNDYSVLGRQAGDAAVMHSRYHNALMLIQNGKLRVYTTAVYQPEDGQDKKLSLALQNDLLTLSYGEGEQYVFERTEDDYRLKEAEIGGFCVSSSLSPWNTAVYAVSDGAASCLWWDEILLSQFNIDLFPRTIEEVRHRMSMLAALDSGEIVFPYEYGLPRSGVGEGTAPVYSAPDTAAWRAGKGKAAVGLKGDLWVLFGYEAEEGEQYACIRYDVSQRTQRIGFVRQKDIGIPYSDGINDQMINVDVVAMQDTYLTDDPDVSQYPQFDVPAGTQLNCKAIYDREYAYVSGEVRDGGFADDGQAVWGFVPLRDLQLDPHGNHARVIQPDAMEKLVGAWWFWAGGNQAQDKLVFYPDGTYRGINPTGDDMSDDEGASIDTGTYTVTAYDPACNLYWNDPPYELTLMDDTGRVNIKGLSFYEEEGEDAFSLSYWEGSGGYRRIEDQ